MTGERLRVLTGGPGYIAIDKPPGALVIPGREAGEASLRERLEAELGAKIFVVHRLDRDTSGVLLFALDAATHRTLSMAFEAGSIGKRYLALVAGRVEGPLEMSGALTAGRKGKMRVARPGELGKEALTRARPVETFSQATLLAVEPLSGRTHQIRVHLAQAGHPLLFDPRYGRADPVHGLTRTPLHAATLSLPALEGISARTIEAPLPADLAGALEALRRS